MAKHKCQWCGKEYLPRQHNQRFHSSVCADAFHQDERRRAVEMLRSQTYFGRAEVEAAENPGRYASVGAVRFGEALPVPAHLRDPVPAEPPLGLDIETVPEEARR